MSTTTATDKQIRCFLPPSDHQRVRVAAAANDQSMAEFVQNAAREAAEKTLKKLLKNSQNS